MLSRIISSKLAQGRRLVVPQLGVFIVAGDGRILFSELLTGDDGELRAAVAAGKGVSEAEAAELIGRFVANIRTALEHGTSYRLENFGALQLDDRGKIIFTAHNALPEEPAAKAEEEAPAAIDELWRHPAPAAAENLAETAAEQPRNARRTGGGGVDIFMITAVVVALAALAVILYGYLQSKARDEGVTMTEMFSAPASGSESGAGDRQSSGEPEPDGQSGNAAADYGQPYDLSVPSSK